tara:strand:- start:248 stop:511 length:264 start_codon:yes stop_codon:yes gene_type:complete
MYLSKAQGNAIARAIFEIELASEVIHRTDKADDETRLAGFKRKAVAERALKDMGINVDFFTDTPKVSDKGFEIWWDMKQKHADTVGV